MISPRGWDESKGKKMPSRPGSELAVRETWYEVQLYCDDGAAAGASMFVRQAILEGHRARLSEDDEGAPIALVLVRAANPAPIIERLFRSCDLSGHYRALKWYPLLGRTI
jgi:hypothetical protein